MRKIYKGTLIFLLLLVPVWCLASSVSLSLCSQVLALLSPSSKSATQNYLILLKDLVENKNAFDIETLRSLSFQKAPVNPFDVATVSLSPEQKFAYRLAFQKILEQRDGSDFKWGEIRKEFMIYSERKIERDAVRNGAKIETAEIVAPELLNESFPPLIETIEEFHSSVAPLAYNNGKPIILYTHADNDKLVILNLTSKKYRTIKLKRARGYPGDIYPFQLNKESFISFEAQEEGLSIYDLNGNRRNGDLLPKGISLKQHDDIFENIAFSQANGKLVLVKADAARLRNGTVLENAETGVARGALILIPVGDPKKKVTRIFLDEGLQEDANEYTVYPDQKKTPSTYNFKNGPVAGIIDVSNIVYVVDPFTGHLYFKKEIKNAVDKIVFYEVNGEPRAFVRTMEYGSPKTAGLAIFNPFTGEILKKIKINVIKFPRNIVFWSKGDRHFAVIPGGSNDSAGDIGFIIDLDSNNLIKERIPLLVGRWNYERRVTSNLASIEFNGQTNLIWGDAKGNIILYDPNSMTEIFRKKVSDGEIETINTYRNGDHWEAFVVPHAQPPFILNLTVKARPGK